MPWYNDLRPDKDDHKENYALTFPNMENMEKKRTIINLLELRTSLDKQIANKINDENLIIGTWNLKEFGHLQERLPESYFYIAEILNRFDLIAVQEVKSSLRDLQIIMRLLGKNWSYLVADITEGKDGNSERFAYIFDKRRVNLSGLAGEIVLWDDLTKNSNVKQLKRTPYITGFKAGWKSFSIINVHLQPGKSNKDKAKRKEEVTLLLKAIKKKLLGNRLWSENLMLMGDFNLYKNDSDIVEEINKAGFKEIEDLKGKTTNASESEIYDRIFYHENKYFQIAKHLGKTCGDVFKVFNHVYTEAEVNIYKKAMKEHKNEPSTLTDNASFLFYYRRYWRRNQISDHYPVWVQMLIDSSEGFLEEKLQEFSES